RVLLAPGVESISANADRHVEVESDRESAPAGPLMALGELLVRDPFHEFVIGDFFFVRPPQHQQEIVIRPAPLQRPFPPWSAAVGPPPLEKSKMQQSGAAGAPGTPPRHVARR